MKYCNAIAICLNIRSILKFMYNMNYTSVKHFFNCNKIYLNYKNFRRLCSNFSNDKTVYIETYGCQMNFNDSEIAMSILKSDGYTHTNNLHEASVVLLMTCAIREGAEDKIWGRLKYFHSMNKRSSKLKIGVLGCMAERLKSKLLENTIAPVNLVCGPDAYRDLPRLLEEVKAGRKGMNVALSLEETYAEITPVRLSSNGIPSAFVSIMRGCDNMCTYCIVPFTRGKERSRLIDSILKEVQTLSDQGIKEVVLLGQNVNSYRDMSESKEIHGVISKEKTKLAEGFSTVYKTKVGGRRFVDLLDAVSKVNKEMRIRFTSPHPKDFPDEVLHLIKDTPNICKQLHLPAQSGSSSVLQQMGRGYTREAYLNLVDKVRSIIPNVALTSDFISGFCGETEEDHQLTLSLIRVARYSFVFCYPYSMREKTKAFHRLVDDVSEEIKSRRHIELASEFRKIALEVNQALIGSIQLVLIDGTSKRSSDEWVGRNDANTKVIFPKLSLPFNIDLTTTNEIPRIGDYVAVRITSATSQTLKGDPICRSSIATFNPDIINSCTDTNLHNKIPYECYS